jgi:alkylhydroperoxidase family enzyme
MRLREVERGDTLRARALIWLISLVTRMRLPDAARVAFYHRGFAGTPFGEWTQAAMRGPSTWSVGQRELMAAMVAQWNSNRFCRGAHRAIAIHGIDPSIVDACLTNYRTAPVDEKLRAVLVFLEKMTQDPEHLNAVDARTALDAGATRTQLTDAAAVAAVFNTITRNADALDFAIPTDAEYAKSATMLLKRGYS